MTQGPIGEAHVLVVPDLGRFAAELKAKLDAVFRAVGDPQVEVEADVKGFTETVKRTAAQTERTTKPKIRVAPDLSKFSAEVRTFLARFDPEEQVKIAAAMDRASFAKVVAEAKALAKAADPKIEVEVDIDRRNFLKTLITPHPELFEALKRPLARGLSTPLGLAVAASLTQVLTVALPAAISLGLGAGLIALGAFALRGSTILKRSFKGAGAAISESLERAAQPLKGPFLQAIRSVTGALIQLQPQFRGLFQALAPSIKPFVDGMTGFVRQLLPNLQAAMPAVTAAFAEMGARLPGLGRTLGGVFAAISENLPAIKRGIDLLFTFSEVILNVAGALLTLGQRVSNSFANVGAAFAFVKEHTLGLASSQKEASKSTGDLAAGVGALAIAEQTAAAAKTVLTEKTAKLTDKLKELQQQFRDQVATVRDSIESYKGLITQSGVTASQVIKDLRNQVANFRTYSKDVKRLIKEGVSQEAIQELSKKGPQFVHALATGTNTELERYKRFWRERQAEVRGGFAKSMELQLGDLARKIKAMQKEINQLKGRSVIVTARGVFKAPKGIIQLPGGGGDFSTAGQRYGGGPITTGVRSRDSTWAMLRKDEHVWTPEEVDAAGGHGAIYALRRAILNGWRPLRFAAGGAVEDARPGRPTGAASLSQFQEGVAGFDRNVDRFALALGKSLGSQLNFGGSGKVSGVKFGGAAMTYIADFLRKAGVMFQIISGFRAGARTRGTGSVSLHALGRALDFVGAGGSSMLDIWRAATKIPFKKEVIFSPAPFQVYGSGKHPGPPTNPATRADHYNHVHVGLFDRGGWLMPGLTLAENRSGRPERVVPATRDPLGRLGFGGQGVTIQQLVVQPLAGRFRLADVLTELALQGVR